MKDTLRDDFNRAIDGIVSIGGQIDEIEGYLDDVASDLINMRERIINDSKENEKEGNKTYEYSIGKIIRNEDSTFHNQYLNVELNETEMKKFEELLKEFKSC